MAYNLTGNFSADGSSSAFELSDMVTGGNVPLSLHLSGDFGDGIVHLERLAADGSTYKVVIGQRYTSDDDAIVDMSPGESVRLTLSGSTSPDLDYELKVKAFADWL